MNLTGTLPLDKLPIFFLKPSLRIKISGEQDPRVKLCDSLARSVQGASMALLLEKSNKKKTKSKVYWELLPHQCIDRKRWALLKSFLVNIKPVFKYEYSCWRIDRALRIRRKAGTDLPSLASNGLKFPAGGSVPAIFISLVTYWHPLCRNGGIGGHFDATNTNLLW